MVKFSFRLILFTTLTVLTQVGGLAYIITLLLGRSFIVFLVAYMLLTTAATWVAPQFGRVPLACSGTTGLLVQSKLTCLLNRHYVSVDMKSVTDDLAVAFPDARALDANFPFLDGFPLLPHLSHDDGDKLDLGFIYSGAPKSPIGYWGFEGGPTDCLDQTLSLRWDLDWLQHYLHDGSVDMARSKDLVEWLAQRPDVSKVFLEPHLKIAWGITSDKVRFQGCRAARHDDHIHFQL